MATGLEREEGERPCPDALDPANEAPSFGHFPDEDAVDQDHYFKYLRMVNLGINAKLILLSRILSRCEITEDTGIGPCYLWSGPTSGNGRGRGYGRFSFEGKTASVHRTVYEICWGPIPPRKQVDHECKNRRCCNPDHLKRVTHKQNQKLRDARNKT